MKKLIVAVAALGLCSGVPAAAQDRRDCEPADVTRRLAISQSTYTTDEPVRIRMTVKNNSDRPCEMTFPSGRGGTVRIFKGGHAVWEHGLCRAYTAHIEFRTWEPGHREVYRFRWRQWMNAQDEAGRLDCDGKRYRASSGRYEVVGEFFGTEPNSDTPRLAFHITR